MRFKTRNKKDIVNRNISRLNNNIFNEINNYNVNINNRIEQNNRIMQRNNNEYNSNENINFVPQRDNENINYYLIIGLIISFINLEFFYFLFLDIFWQKFK